MKTVITEHRVIHAGDVINEYGSKPVIASWYDITNVSGEDLTPINLIMVFSDYQDGNPNSMNRIEIGSRLMPVSSKPRWLTWDRGKELSAHRLLTTEIGLPVYFADPKSPWQRGSNGHLNGLLRQYFPKGTDLSRWSAADIAAVASAMP